MMSDKNGRSQIMNIPIDIWKEAQRRHNKFFSINLAELIVLLFQVMWRNRILYMLSTDPTDLTQSPHTCKSS